MYDSSPPLINKIPLEDGWAGHPNTTHPDGGQAGVIEAHPGIIESTNIAPLDKTSNKGDFTYHKIPDFFVSLLCYPPDGSWVNATSRGMMNTASSMAGAASTMATGAVKATYGTATGRKDLAEEGKKEFMG
jgi:hypothetical protein